jgi:hypothetical protein
MIIDILFQDHGSTNWTGTFGFSLLFCFGLVIEVFSFAFASGVFGGLSLWRLK